MQRRTGLTHDTLYQCITRRTTELLTNCDTELRKLAETINNEKNIALADGVGYRCLNAKELQEGRLEGIFDDLSDTNAEDVLHELSNVSVLPHRCTEITKSTFERISLDSMGIERQFAEDCDKNGSVKWFMKLSKKFEINTPIGGYTPDWGLVVESNDRHLVVETKGSLKEEDMRGNERNKIDCGKRYFESIDVIFNVAMSLEGVMGGLSR